MSRVLTCLGTEHDWRLVLLAAAVCLVASLAAVCLFQRALATRSRVRAGWTASAGAATGCGIWATHFIAMLAYEPGVPVAYDVGLTVLSLTWRSPSPAPAWRSPRRRDPPPRPSAA